VREWQRPGGPTPRPGAAAGAAGFGLVLHWYNGAVADERFHLGRAAFPLAALDPELLAHMPHDTLYWFTTRP
jgi:hypothetical protein